MESGRVYKISVTVEDESGTVLTGLGDTYSIAPGAIVDPGANLSKD